MAKQVPNELITNKEQSTDNQFLQIEPLIRTIRGQHISMMMQYKPSNKLLKNMLVQKKPTLR